MKNIEWLGQERNIPKHGIFNTGDVRQLPDALADNFIKQGLCKSADKKPAKVKEGSK